MANYHFQSSHPEDRWFEELSEYIALQGNDYEMSLAKILFIDSFQLNQNFRSETTEKYVRFIGGPDSLNDAYSFDFWSMLFRVNYFEDLVSAVYRTFVSPLDLERG